MVASIPIGDKDEATWILGSGKFTVKSAWEYLCGPTEKPLWIKSI